MVKWSGKIFTIPEVVMSSFFSMVLRMKYINRWGLMKNSRYETLSEHSLDVAIIAHALAAIRNQRMGGQLNAERAALLAIFHDASEIITGDLPTPIKYYNSDITASFKNIENAAGQALFNMIPQDLRCEYDGIFLTEDEDKELWRLVKAADKISALIKCIDEETAGNRDFAKAKQATANAIEEMDCPEADIFVKEFLPSFYLTLDEQ